MTSSAASETDSARNRGGSPPAPPPPRPPRGDAVRGGAGPRGRGDPGGAPPPRHAAQPLPPAAVGHVHVEQDDVGPRLGDQPHRLVDRPRVAHHLDEPVELGAHAGPEQPVVVDDDDARHFSSSVSSTSVPAPGAAVIRALPPWRAIRATIDSRTPRRSSGTAAGSKPAPRSRTKTCSRPSAASA